MALRYQELGETRPDLEVVGPVPTIVHAELAAVRALLVNDVPGAIVQHAVLSREMRLQAIDVATNFFAVNPQQATERVLGISSVDLNLIHEVVTAPKHAEKFAQEQPGLAADFLGLLQIDAELNDRDIRETGRLLSNPDIHIPSDTVIELQRDLLGVTISDGEQVHQTAFGTVSEDVVFDISVEGIARKILTDASSFSGRISFNTLLRKNQKIANEIMKSGLPLDGGGNHLTVPSSTIIEAMVRASGNPRAVRKAIERQINGGK